MRLLHWGGRREWDSNPRGLFTLPLFESGTFDHSDISPPRSIAYVAPVGKHFTRLIRPVLPLDRASGRIASGNLRPYAGAFRRSHKDARASLQACALRPVQSPLPG